MARRRGKTHALFMHVARVLVMSVLIALPLGACSSGSANSSGGTGTPLARGSVTGGDAEAAAIVVAWSVSSGSPDYTYAFGGGKYDGTKFVVSFSGNPPPEAINSYGVGIGFVVLLKPGTQAPATGKVDFDALDASLVGLSARYAIIWKDGAGQGLDWSSAMPAGYSCGKCVSAADGAVFDSYEPTDCSALEIDVSGSAEVCNWT